MMIGIVGSGVRSGKSTAANAIGGTIAPMAATFKRMLAVLLRDCHISDERIHEYLYGALKEDIIPELGVSGRYLMQTLGTDWGRNTVDEDLWIKVWVLKNQHTQGTVVCDDVRFQNEVDHLRESGARVLKVVGQDTSTEANSHESEGQPLEVDHTIANDKTICHLEQAVREYVFSY
jgi:hypothetical protein